MKAANNLCLISIVLGMIAMCIVLPLLILNVRAGMVALVVAMVGIPAGFGGKLLIMFWEK